MQFQDYLQFKLGCWLRICCLQKRELKDEDWNILTKLQGFRNSCRNAILLLNILSIKTIWNINCRIVKTVATTFCGLFYFAQIIGGCNLKSLSKLPQWTFALKLLDILYCSLQQLGSLLRSTVLEGIVIVVLVSFLDFHLSFSSIHFLHLVQEFI